jgi:hypothetical protein
MASRVVQARHREIAHRYRRARKRPRLSMAALRIAELTRIFRARYGDQLPDDDAGRADAAIVAHHLTRRPGDPHRRIAAFLELCAPWMSADERDHLIADVIARPRRWKADTLAQRLNLTDAERRRLAITTIGSIDKTKAERLADRKARDRLRQQQRRRAKGAKPRAQYTGQSVTHVKPWQTMGISRAAWYRHRQQRSETGASAA